MRKRRYKYSGSGRCRRCKNRTSARRKLWRQRCRYRNPPPSPPPQNPGSSSSGSSSSGSFSPFGVDDLILVDAVRNKDLPGALECKLTVNKCLGSATRLNVRAEVYGNVESVMLKSTGPIEESGWKEGIALYAVWGDGGRSEYNRMNFLPGTYTVTAQATNSQGRKSFLFEKTFTLKDQASVTAAAAPDPTPLPTAPPSLSPTESLTFLPTVASSGVPTVSPTAAPTVAPTVGPTASPTSSLSKSMSDLSGEALSISIDTLVPRSRQEKYLLRLSTNLDASNTNCTGVKQAMEQWTGRRHCPR